MIDLRGLDCPKPFQKATAEAMMLSPGETILLQIGIYPQPLLDYLEQHNFSFEAESTTEGEFLIYITAQEDSIQLSTTIVQPPQS